MKAWHFVNDTLRDGRKVPRVGTTLKHDGDIELCQSGLHASKKILDALEYAPGNTLCRVECGGKIIHGDDKLVCTERKILWKIDFSKVAFKFARMCALDVVHLWDAPEVVVQYLRAGDESIRYAAWDAAWSEDSWSAERSAARYATWDAARPAARDAARYAARATAWDAARPAARDAAWDAARDEHREKQERRLYRMVMAERKKK